MLMVLKNEDSINISHVNTVLFSGEINLFFRCNAQSDMLDVALFLQEQSNKHRILMSK